MTVYSSCSPPSGFKIRVRVLWSNWLETTYACPPPTQNLHKLHFAIRAAVYSRGLMSGGVEQLLRVYSVTLNFKYPIIFDTV